MFWIMKLAALISGGKDSLYALYCAKLAGHDIKKIVVMQTDNQESYMFHYPNTWIVEIQAALMNIPFVAQTTAGVKELELNDMEDILKKIKDIDGVVTGAVASNYQKKRIDDMCERLELQSIAPLWDQEPTTIIESMIRDRFEIIIQAVAAPPLDEKWLGKKLDVDCLNELIELNKTHGIHVNGEGGEYESLVTDCPVFSKKILIKNTEKRWDSKTRSGDLIINTIDLVKKK
jgi:ABC transporter with metal-binding/Fe-S-binding domain ATP-binding protein